MTDTAVTVSVSTMTTSSWLPNVPDDSDFSLYNIPFGVGSLKNDDDNTGRRFCCTAIGNHVINLHVLQSAGVFDDITYLDKNCFAYPVLNAFMDHPLHVWKDVRQRIIDIFTDAEHGEKDVKNRAHDEKKEEESGAVGVTASINYSMLVRHSVELQKACIYDMSNVKMHLPAHIGDYTDFYSSREHATNGT